MAHIKKEKELAAIRHAGTIVRDVLVGLKSMARPGISLIELDALAEAEIRKAGAVPSFLNYRPSGADRPYPATLCASLNEVIVHGVPTARKLKSGDILKLDLGAKYEGYHADAAITVAIGKVPLKFEQLIRVTQEALQLGIEAARVGARVGDISHAIGSYVKKAGMSVAKGLTGHGVGAELHEDPSVFNDGDPDTGMVLRVGMVLALEPMVMLGKGDIVQVEDESYASRDGSISAHFEHTIIIGSHGPEIITA